MIIKWISRPGTLAAAAIAALVSFAAAGSLGSAQPRAAHLARTLTRLT
jgi:hypothetical protein